MVFDLSKFDGNLSDKMAYLEEFLSLNPSSFIKVVKQTYIQNNSHAFAFLDEVVSKGGEGIVVRDPNASYISGRSDKILKLKKWNDSECQIVAINNGKGKYEGRNYKYRGLRFL